MKRICLLLIVALLIVASCAQGPPTGPNYDCDDPNGVTGGAGGHSQQHEQ